MVDNDHDVSEHDESEDEHGPAIDEQAMGQHGHSRPAMGGPAMGEQGHPPTEHDHPATDEHTGKEDIPPADSPADTPTAPGAKDDNVPPCGIPPEGEMPRGIPPAGTPQAKT